MKLTVTSPASVTSLDIPDDLEVENLKAFCEAQTDIPAQQMIIIHEGKRLDDPKRTVTDYGIRDGDMILVEKKAASVPPAASAGGLQLPDFSGIQVCINFKSPILDKKWPSLSENQTIFRGKEITAVKMRK